MCNIGAGPLVGRDQHDRQRDGMGQRTRTYTHPTFQYDDFQIHSPVAHALECAPLGERQRGRVRGVGAERKGVRNRKAGNWSDGLLRSVARNAGDHRSLITVEAAVSSIERSGACSFKGRTSSRDHQDPDVPHFLQHFAPSRPLCHSPHHAIELN